jgi:nuclear transport factor 2 (NTF2) superfamily protein
VHPNHTVFFKIMEGTTFRASASPGQNPKGKPMSKEGDRKYHWPLGRRPDDHPSLSDLGL